MIIEPPQNFYYLWKKGIVGNSGCYLSVQTGLGVPNCSQILPLKTAEREAGPCTWHVHCVPVGGGGHPALRSPWDRVEEACFSASTMASAETGHTGLDTAW